MSSQATIDGLNGLLADAIVFYYKLHNYHWNVKGPNFYTLHEQFEKLYDEWADIADDLAERIKSLGGFPLPTLAACVEHAKVAEETGSPDATAMVTQLVKDIHTQRERMKAVSETAQSVQDKTTENVLDDFIDATAEHVWMLSAYLGKNADED